MHFYFDYVYLEYVKFPANWELLTTESIGDGYFRSRVDALIENDSDAMTTTAELGGMTAFQLNMAQIKEACSVNDVDEMKIIPPANREKIFQVAIRDDWQFE